MTDWRNRIVKVADVPPGDLKAHPYNWRDHPQAQDDALAQSLDVIGWVKRAVVNINTGHIIDGHLRVDRAVRHGEPTIPVIYVDLTENEERLALAVFDPVANEAATDDEKIRELAGMDLSADVAPLVAAMAAEHLGQGKPTGTDDGEPSGDSGAVTCPRCGTTFDPADDNLEG